MIFQVTSFKNDKGQQIDAYSEHGEGLFISTYSKFVGKAVGLFDTPQGKQPMPYEFSIEATTIGEAYEKFEAAAHIGGEARQQQIEDQVRRSRLLGK